MSRADMLPAVLALCFFTLVFGESRAGESSDQDRQGWSRVDAVPVWVGAPPAREGYFRFVDGSQSNLLDLAYPDPETDVARRNVGLLVLSRLALLLGAEARAVSEVAAAAAKPVEQVFLFRPSPRGKEAALGATLYTAFVLWEVPSGPLLRAVPVKDRSSVEAALSAPPRGSGTPWKELPRKPSWAVEKPTAEGRLYAATKHASGPWPVAKALADLRSGSAVQWEVQRRLRPVLGNDLASEVAMLVGGRCRLHERVRVIGEAGGWQLWSLDFDDVLPLVPATHRAVARAALASPAPPRPWNWEDAVHVEPTWVAQPPVWPGHIAVVQRRRANLPQSARRLSARMGERDVAEVLAARLSPVVGRLAAQGAADAGAGRRQLVRKAIQDVPAAAGAGGEPRERQVTLWTLWEVPVEAVLDALPRDRWKAVRAALTER